MSTRKGSKTPNTQPRVQPEIVGLDIGYGVVKVAYGETRIKFPSVAAHAHNLKFQANQISAKYPGDEISDNEGDWFIGDLAIKQAPASERIFLRGRTNNEEFNMAFRLRMLKVSLAKIMPHQNGDVVHVIISTGLPVDHMADAALLKSTLTGYHPIKTNNADFVVNVVEVIVVPQPAAVIYSVMMTAHGELNPYHTATTTGVVDVGTFTLDVALDDDGEFVDAQGGTLESGIHAAQKRIEDVFEAEFRTKPTPKQIEQILHKGVVKVNGVGIDYSHHSREALKPVRDGLKSLMGTKWGVATHVDLILVAGGGAEVVDKDVLQVYPQATVVDDPQMAIATGYLYYARYVINHPE